MQLQCQYPQVWKWTWGKESLFKQGASHVSSIMGIKKMGIKKNGLMFRM